MYLNDETTDFIKTFARDFGVTLSGTDCECEEYDEEPVSFNPESGRIGWSGWTLRWIDFSAKQYSFECQGARISGAFPKPLTLSISGDKYDDYNTIGDKVLAAIRAIAGPINYDGTIFEVSQ